MSLHWIRYGLGLLILATMLGHALHRYEIALVTRLEAIAYDSRLRLTMPQTQDDRVVIVDIDERSLAEQGRWPWGRDKLAALVSKLFDTHGAAVLGFDIVFAEADESSGLMSLERLSRGALMDNAAFQGTLQKLRPQLDNDARFAEAIKGRPVVLGYPFSNAVNGVNTGSLPKPVLLPGDFSSEPGAYAFRSYGGNLERFQSVAASGGHFNPVTDLDGITRRVPMLARYDNRYYESLSLAMVRARLGFPALAPGYSPGALTPEWLELQGADQTVLMQVPVDAHLATLVPYRGHAHSFPYISASDVLNDKVPAGFFKDKLVLVGTTAPGLLDLHATPVEAAYPGVEVHANLVAGMLEGTLKQPPSFVLIDAFMLLVVGAIMIFVLPLLSPGVATVTAMLVALGVTGLNLALWNAANLVLPLANVLIMVALLFALNMSWGYFIESRRKRQFTELFGQYIPPELVEVMAHNPGNYSMDGRKAELTVLFSDIRGFTTISEGLQPEELATLMNEYLGAMTDVVRHHRGTLDKYIGDAIMAFWGAPVDDPAHARNAVLTALDMQARLVELNKVLAAKGWPHLAIGVGVNTGHMTVGDMGSPVRKSYTVMGDAVNLGSRLEGITKEYGVGIIVGEETRAMLLSEFSFCELDCVRVKGKDEAICIYEPVGLTAELSQEVLDELELWQQFLHSYRAQAWDRAELSLMDLQRRSSRYLYEKYAGAIIEHRKNPPGENWDGVTVFKTK